MYRMILRKPQRIKMFQEEPLAKNIRDILLQGENGRVSVLMRVSCEHVKT